MKSNLKALASLVLVSAMAGHAQVASTATSGAAHKTRAHHRRAKAPVKPSIESQIESLRQEMETQIQALRQQLADRNAQLQQAQQTAAQAQATAQQAQQAAQSQQQAQTADAQTVSSLQGAVADLKTTTQASVVKVEHQQAKLKKQVYSPDELHYKGITLSPAGSYLAAESVYRTRGTASGIATPFSAVPLENANEANLSEFNASARQSRIALLAQGKLANMTLRGYYELDWLGTGVTSNNNQSNSYVMRQRQLWAQAQLASGWTFTGGQMWSLATEYKKGIVNRGEVTPATIDPNYVPGFVWARQYGFRVVKDFNKFALAVSIENPQTLTPSCTGSSKTSPCPTNYLIGASGTGGGLYNSTATYSYNLAPDFIAKAAFDPGWGHYEVFGIARFFRDRVYPNAGAATPSSAGAYNDSTVGGGIGGNLLVPTLSKRLDVGLSGLWGQGVSRYGDSTLPDTTLRPDGQLALLHSFSALGSLTLHASPRLDLYANYGGDYVGRRYFATPAGYEGYGSPAFVNTGCDTEPLPGGATSPANPSTCAANTKDVQEFTIGTWYNYYKGPMGQLRQGLQYGYINRNTWSGVGGTPQGIDNAFWTSFRYYLP